MSLFYIMSSPITQNNMFKKKVSSVFATYESANSIYF